MTMQFANTHFWIFQKPGNGNVQSMGVVEPILGRNRFWEANSATEKSNSEMMHHIIVDHVTTMLLKSRLRNNLFER